MPLRPEEDTLSSLEHARESLYNPVDIPRGRDELRPAEEHSLPHAWEEKPLPHPQGVRHVRLASIFFGFAAAFFVVALGIAGYFFYFGGNSVSPNNISVDIQGPTTIAGGDTVPLSLTITNRNPVAIQNATIEVDFPDGTKSATSMLAAYPHYVENLGTMQSGAVVTRSIKAVIFGGAGQTVTLPVSFSYGTASSNAVFNKKSSYALAISSTPLSVAVDALSETVSGAPLTFNVTVRSNATIPLNNIVLSMASPFGFSLTSSSIPATNGSFPIGTLAPGASKQVVVTGVLIGQNSEQRTFHFIVGTAKSAQDQTLAVTYMTQDATVSIATPFITTTLALNGNTADNIVIAPGTLQSAVLSYTNTLPTAVTNASITVTIGGSAIDYNSIKTTSGFYNSVNHSIVFSKDIDSSLAMLAPGATGMGTFIFSALPGTISSPIVTLAITAAGTRVGQTNVPEQVTTSDVKTVKVSTNVLLSAASSHTSAYFTQTGPIPPRANQATTYSIIWGVQNKGSAVAGGAVTATLPSYITYTGQSSGAGSFSYDSVSHTMTWSPGDIAQGGSAQGAFQVSFTPSTSQKGDTPDLTSAATFSGYDRFAGMQVSATADPVTTETKGDPGYVHSSGTVQ
ncbi:MAG: hypothetical protein ACHQU0_02075 [Candidatus Paceibacteria bacterium]